MSCSRTGEATSAGAAGTGTGPALKARGASFSLYHVDDGHHRDVCAWHDTDHKAEVLGTVPGVFVSQRWITPADCRGLRAANALDFGGGEYVNLYWTSETGAELADRFDALGTSLTDAGRMRPLEHMHKVWPTAPRASWRPEVAASRPGLERSGGAVLASTATVGIIVAIDVLDEAACRRGLGARHTEELVPAVLATGMFAGAVKLVSDTPGLEGHSVVLYYIDDGVPREVYLDYVRRMAALRAADPGWAEFDRCAEAVFETVAYPSIGQYDYDR